MNKKFLSAVLFGALMVSSTGTFVSCKDYDDDIENLQGQIDKNAESAADQLKKEADALKAQIKDLTDAQATLKSDLADAKKAADKAAEDAAAAKGDAAQVKADLQKAVERVAALEAKDVVLEKAIEDLQKADDEITSRLEALEGDVNLNKDAIAELQKTVTEQVSTLDGLMQTMNGDWDKLSEEAQAKFEKIQNKLASFATKDEVKSQLEGLKTDLELKIAGNTALANALGIRLDKVEGTIKELQAADTKFGEDIKDIQDRLAEYDELNIGTRLEDLEDRMLAAETTLAKAVKDLSDLEENFEEYKDEAAKRFETIENDIKKINEKMGYLFAVLTNQLKSIQLAPDFIEDGVETLLFKTLIYDEMADEQVSDEIGERFEYSTSELSKVSYHFNPKSFDLTCADYDFAQRHVLDITPRGPRAAEKWLQIEGQPVKENDGTVSFQVRRLNAVQSDTDNRDLKMVALQASLKGETVQNEVEGAVITSDYVKMRDLVFTPYQLFISDKATIASPLAHFATTFEEAKETEPRYDLIYDKNLDLRALVGTCFSFYGDDHEAFDTEAYNLDYRFYVASTEYMVNSNGSEGTETNQQTVVELSDNDAEAGVFVTKKLNTGKFDRESIGRTPILKVELVDTKNGNKVVRRGYVKIQIVAEKAADLFVENNEFDTLIFGCADTESTYELNEEWMRANVYRTIASSRGCQSMSHEEFWNTYELDEAYVLEDNSRTGITAPQVVEGLPGQGTATKKITWSFKHGELAHSILGGTRLAGKVVLRNKLASSEFPAKVTLTMVVNVQKPEVTANFVKNEEYWNDNLTAFVVNVATPANTQSPAEECVFKTPISQAFTNHIVLGDAYTVTPSTSCSELFVRISRVLPDNYLVRQGVSLDEDGNICLDKNNAAVKEALNAGELVAFVTYSVDFDSHDSAKDIYTMPVNFVTPLTVTMPTGKYVVDAVTGGSTLDFDFNGMYRDWRGEAVLAPSTELRPDELALPYWRKVCGEDHMVVIPGYQKISKPAELIVTTDTVKVGGETIMFYGAKAKVNFVYNLVTLFGTTDTDTQEYHKLIEVDNLFESPAAAKTMLLAKAYKAFADEVATKEVGEGLEYKLYKKDHFYLTKEEITNSTPATVGQSEVTIITNVVLKPAEYEDVPAQITRTECTAMPEEDGEYIGQRIGCYEWVQPKVELVEYPVAGQYWDFYGKFEPELTLDQSTIKTSLNYNDGKLPSTITLKQDGYKLTYVNVGSPINYTYTITLDAVVSYGWGEIRVPFTFTVYPVGQAPVAPETPEVEA